VRLASLACPYPCHSRASEKARDILRDAARGIDPKQAEKPAKIEAERARGYTFRAVAETYLDDRGKGGDGELRTSVERRRRLENRVFPKWGGRQITEIARADARELVEGIARIRDKPRRSLFWIE
jgi:hypothetical protein